MTDRIDELLAEFDATWVDQEAELLDIAEALRDALERIAKLRAGGPHLSPKSGMSSALDELDRARDIAKVALRKLAVKP